MSGDTIEPVLPWNKDAMKAALRSAADYVRPTDLPDIMARADFVGAICAAYHAALPNAAARVAELEAEIGELEATWASDLKVGKHYQDRALKAEALLEEAVKGLEPFAAAADIRLCGEWEDHRHFGQTDVAFHLTFGDLRRARQALTAIEGK